MFEISTYLRKIIKARIPICDDLDSDFLSCCWSIPSRSDSHLKSLHHEMIQFSNQILFYLKTWSLPLSLFWNTEQHINLISFNRARVIHKLRDSTKNLMNFLTFFFDRLFCQSNLRSKRNRKIFIVRCWHHNKPKLRRNEPHCKNSNHQRNNYHNNSLSSTLQNRPKMLIIPCIQRIKNLISPRTLTGFSFFYFISPILSQNRLFILS